MCIQLLFQGLFWKVCVSGSNPLCEITIYMLSGIVWANSALGFKTNLLMYYYAVVANLSNCFMGPFHWSTKHPAGQPLDPDKLVGITSCHRVEADPKISCIFMWIFVPEPPTFAADWPHYYV